jgi:hypothetical protein
VRTSAELAPPNGLTHPGRARRTHGIQRLKRYRSVDALTLSSVLRSDMSSAVSTLTFRQSGRLPSSRRQLLLISALSAAGAVALAGCAIPGYGNYSPTAGRAATTAEAAAISTSVHSSPLTAGAGRRPFRVIAVRVSRLSPQYAFATIDPTTPQLDGAAVALRRATSSSNTWQTTQVGSAQVGCADPSQVKIEFALHC